MYKKFDLEIRTEEFMRELNVYATYGKELFKGLSDLAGELLTKLLKESVINAEHLESIWFPALSADVFISHSHRDFQTAVELAGWLHARFGLRCFIDSCVWGHYKDILDLAEKDMSDLIFHIQMIVCSAILKMINNTECFLFMKTGNSTDASYSDLTGRVFSNSPWIYFESILSDRISVTVPSRSIVEDIIKAHDRSFKLLFPMNNSCAINEQTLLKWLSFKDEFSFDSNPAQYLDILYSISPA